MTLTMTSRVGRSGTAISAQVDGQTVALDVNRGVCYGLNAVGTRIWDLIAEPATVDDICSRLLSEYEVSPSDCRAQTQDLLEDLHREGLLLVID